MKVLCIQTCGKGEYMAVKNEEYTAEAKVEHHYKKGVFGYRLVEFPPHTFADGLITYFTIVYFESKYFIELPDLSEEVLEKEKQNQLHEEILTVFNDCLCAQ